MRHFETTSKVRMYSRKRRPRTTWKQKLNNITMKKNHTRIFPLIEFSMSQMRFWKQKAGAQALKNDIKKFKCILKIKGPRTTWKQKLTDITLKTYIQCLFKHISEFSSAQQKHGSNSKFESVKFIVQLSPLSFKLTFVLPWNYNENKCSEFI